MNGGIGASENQWGLWPSLEVGGLDFGADPAGFSNNFEHTKLIIGSDAHVFLQDLFDNGNRSAGNDEALYVDTLIFSDSLGQLNLNGLNIYYNNLVGNTSQIINQVVPIPAAAWLFGSGLLGLVGIAGRKKAA
jgi:hypothetical protein